MLSELEEYLCNKLGDPNLTTSRNFKAVDKLFFDEL